MAYSFTLSQLEKYALSESRRCDGYEMVREVAGIPLGVLYTPRQSVEDYILMMTMRSKTPRILVSQLDSLPAADEYQLYVDIYDAVVAVRTVERDARCGLVSEEDAKYKTIKLVKELKSFLAKVDS